MRKYFINSFFIFVFCLPINLMAQTKNYTMPLQFEKGPTTSTFNFELDYLNIKDMNYTFYKINDCDKNLIGQPLTTTPFNKLNQLNAIFNLNICEEAYTLTDANRLTESMCTAQVNCVNAMYNSGVSLNIDSMIENEKVAEEVLAKEIKDKIGEMDSLNKIKKFAEKKYPKLEMSQICNIENIFETHSKCKMNIVNNAFEMSQNKCMIEKLNCFPVVPDAKADPKEGSTLNLMDSYFQKRNAGTLEKSMANDDLILQTISETLADKKSSSDEKMKAVYEKLHKNEKLLDPVFSQFIYGYSLDNVNIHFDLLLKHLISSSNTSSIADIKMKLDDLRLEETKQLLLQKCSEVPTVTQLCKMSKDLTSGGDIHASREQIMETINTREHSNWSILTKEKKLLQDANRCVTFGMGGNFAFSRSPVLTEYTSPLNPNIKLNSVLPNFNSTKEHYVMNRSGNITAPSWRVTEASRSPISENAPNALSDFKAGTINTSTPLSVSIASPAEKTITANTPAAPTIKSAINPIQPNSNLNTFSPSVNPNELNPNGASSKTLPNNGMNSSGFSGTDNTALNEQINQISKKINSNQKRFAKLADSKPDKSESASKAVENDKSTVLSSANLEVAKGLEKEIADLKSQQEKENSAAKAKEKDNKNTDAIASAPTENSSGTLGPATMDSAKEKEIEKNNYTERESVGTTTPNHSESATATIEAPALTRAAQTAASTSSSNATLVLTKNDGAEVIANKIIEQSSGESFFIEEDGKFKEVVPMMNGTNLILDAFGKPRFEKKIKCESSDKACIELNLQSKLSHKKSASPNSTITSIGDLKRYQEEQLNLDRAEYLKLKALTNKTFEKSNPAR
jgi:hypothetical protein